MADQQPQVLVQDGVQATQALVQGPQQNPVAQQNPVVQQNQDAQANVNPPDVQVYFLFY